MTTRKFFHVIESLNGSSMTFLKSEVLVIVKSFSLDGRQDKKGRELCLSRLNCCVWAYLGTNVASAPSKVNFEHLEDGHCNFLNHFTDFTTSFCKLASTTKNGKLFLFLCFEETEENGQQECPKKGGNGEESKLPVPQRQKPLLSPSLLFSHAFGLFQDICIKQVQTIFDTQNIY